MGDISNPLYWNNLWQQNLKKHMGKDPVAGWNKKAISFNKSAQTEQGNKRIEKVLEFLIRQKVIKKGIRVLDIGCGPGNFSIPLAQMGAQVTALDPAINMLEILNSRIKKENIQNIKIVQGLWEEIIIEDAGWYKEFDLVFASQSPGLRDLQTLEKMNACSTHYCFATGFDGKRQMSLYDAFFAKYFNRPYLRNSHNIIYLINLIYSLGHRPTVEFLNLSRSEEYNEDEFKSSLKEIIDLENLNLRNYDQVISEFLTLISSTPKGYYKQDIRQVIGMVLWESTIY